MDSGFRRNDGWECRNGMTGRSGPRRYVLQDGVLDFRSRKPPHLVIPANAGIHFDLEGNKWIPASAGMTEEGAGLTDESAESDEG